jgi:hypothetical protein
MPYFGCWVATGVGVGGEHSGSAEAGAVVVPRSIPLSSSASGLSEHGTRSRRAATATTPATSSRVVLVMGPSDDATAKVKFIHNILITCLGRCIAIRVHRWFVHHSFGSFFVSLYMNETGFGMSIFTGWLKFSFIYVPFKFGRGAFAQWFA